MVRAKITKNPSDQAYRTEIYRVAGKAGHSLSSVKVFQDKGYAIAYDVSGYPFKVKLNPKSVARFGAWQAMSKENPSGKTKRKYVIVDAHRKDVLAANYSTDYDKLQTIVDRHNENSDDEWFVVAESDLKGKINNPEVSKAVVRSMVDYIDKTNSDRNLVMAKAIKNSKSLPYRVKVMDKAGRISSFEYKDLVDAKKFANDISKQMECKVAVFDTETGKRLLAIGLKSSNPSGKAKRKYVIVNRVGTKQSQLSVDYDKLQTIVDRHNENNSDWVDTWYVVAESDIRTGGIRSKNHTVSSFRTHQKTRLRDLAQKFQGVANGDKWSVVESDYTPKDKYRLGYLKEIKFRRNGEVKRITFDGENGLVAADLRNNLHFVGEGARLGNIPLPKKGQLMELGQVVSIDYITAKKHIENNETVRFTHKLGEVTGERPTLFVDYDGFPILAANGGYDIWSVGVVN